MLALWWIIVVQSASMIFPTPPQVLAGTIELVDDGSLWRHIGNSLFRVGCGFLAAPFSSLDALMNLRMRTELLRILQEERHTVLLITHDVDEALCLSDRVIVLSARPAVIQAASRCRSRIRANCRAPGCSR